MLILLVPNLKTCHFLHQTSIFQHQDSKYNNCCLKHPNIALLVQNWRILIFAGNFRTRQFKGRWLQIWQWIFNILAQDRNRAFLAPNLFFSFYMKLYSFTNSRVLIKSLMLRTLVPSLKFFCFWMKLCKLTNLRMLTLNAALLF